MNKQNKQLLNDLYMADQRIKWPSFPDFARPPRKYEDKTANGLTKCIIEFLNFIGHQAERISSMGRAIDKREISTDVLGNKRQIGSMKYIPGTSTNGTADISSVIHGYSVKIEVKIGQDKQSVAQKKYQASVENAGGIYLIAKDFDGFIEEYLKLISTDRKKYTSPLGRELLLISESKGTIQFLDNYEIRNISQNQLTKIITQ